MTVELAKLARLAAYKVRRASAVDLVERLAPNFLSLIEAVIARPKTSETLAPFCYAGEAMRFLGFVEPQPGVQVRFSDQVEERVAEINRLSRERVSTLIASFREAPAWASLDEITSAVLLAGMCTRLLVYRNAEFQDALLGVLKAGLTVSPAGLWQHREVETLRKFNDMLSEQIKWLEADSDRT